MAEGDDFAKLSTSRNSLRDYEFIKSSSTSNMTEDEVLEYLLTTGSKVSEREIGNIDSPFDNISNRSIGSLEEAEAKEVIKEVIEMLDSDDDLSK